jgi:hypothetical protein
MVGNCDRFFFKFPWKRRNNKLTNIAALTSIIQIAYDYLNDNGMEILRKWESNTEEEKK